MHYTKYTCRTKYNMQMHPVVFQNRQQPAGESILPRTQQKVFPNADILATE